MDDSRLCCPDCENCLEVSEWKDLEDKDGNIICPECEEEMTMDDLVSEEGLDEDDETYDDENEIDDERA